LSITALIVIGIVATALLHFAGVYTKSIKLVWIVILFMWAVAIGTFTNEIKPKGYKEIAKMKGRYEDTDKLIRDAGKKVSFYELLQIKRSYYAHHPEE